jgi:hypothetical protein
MTNSYRRLGMPPSASACAVLRAAIRALHPDTLRVRSFREARKRYYRELLDQHAAAQRAAPDAVS